MNDETTIDRYIEGFEVGTLTWEPTLLNMELREMIMDELDWYLDENEKADVKNVFFENIERCQNLLKLLRNARFLNAIKGEFVNDFEDTCKLKEENSALNAEIKKLKDKEENLKNLIEEQHKQIKSKKSKGESVGVA